MITIPKLEFYMIVFLLFSFLVPDLTLELYFLGAAFICCLLSIFYSIRNEIRMRRFMKTYSGGIPGHFVPLLNVNSAQTKKSPISGECALDDREGSNRC